MPDGSKPNILVIWGDDIGIANLSCYTGGLMGYRTPNIDRLADEGMRFTDSYGEQSCTAGRASFITGQSVYRTGLSKVGVPGADIGLRAEHPTIAELLKPLGYATGQFGKNHLGDKNEFLPTVHGFDEFYGSLYHLNAEEEPEQPNYPSPEDFPQYRARYGPRGVLRTWATDKEDENVDERFGRVGKQRIEDTGPLTKKRMETIDDDTVAAAMDFIRRKTAEQTPFFVWMNTTHMHLRTHPKPESVGQAGRWQSTYHDTMIDHDKHVGLLLDQLDELGIADDTIVIYSTDNGPHMNTWPDGGMTPFRSEKNTNWEGAFRVPELIRWPGKIPAGVVSNEIVQHHDWLPTLVAAAGDPDIVDKLKTGHTADFLLDNAYLVFSASQLIGEFLATFEEFPPRQRAASFTIDQALEKLQAALTAGQ
ncbi:arylsulfatase [Kribbella sp. NPDC050820]|uniref:arylsulfatase n=1 Tax=Kribbella sp. NPDC050820 TaxID=3155408 RepID=UPI0033C03E06